MLKIIDAQVTCGKVVSSGVKRSASCYSTGALGRASFVPHAPADHPIRTTSLSLCPCIPIKFGKKSPEVIYVF
jgi:hypothetical protein